MMENKTKTNYTNNLHIRNMSTNWSWLVPDQSGGGSCQFLNPAFPKLFNYK